MNPDSDSGPALDAAASEGATYTRESRDEPAMANTSEKEAESAVNSAALGAAVGVFVGGGAMGPLGIALGAVVGGRRRPGRRARQPGAVPE